MSKIKKAISVILSFIILVCPAITLCSCSQNVGDLRIGVLREDDSSGEAKAWEEYLKSVGNELGFSVDFTTTNSSSSEVSAINTYASKGYNAIMLFSDDDIAASVNAAATKKMYIVCPTGHPSDKIYSQIKDIEYYLGSVAPLPDTEFKAGYDMAKFFVEEKQMNKFTVFGGATSYGSDMHIQRLCGMLSYLCEDSGTSYDGVSDRASLVKKVAGTSLDPSKFKSEKYKITGYMDGFAFDDAFSTKLTNSLEAGGTCILSVGAGEVISKIAYGITKANPGITSFTSGGIDAITSAYSECFDLGYTYDCGKFASAMAPGLILIYSALDGKKIVDDDGHAPMIGMNYWVATSKQDLNAMLESDNSRGYCYNGNVIEKYKNCSYKQLETFCGADYKGAVKIHEDSNSNPNSNINNAAETGK